MTFLFNGVEINYEIIGSGKKHLVFLHGWGTDSTFFNQFAYSLQKDNYTCILIDFPPFGKSHEPTCAWTVITYAEMVNNLILELKIENFDIICHSFGGRVAILISSVYNLRVNNLVMIGSAGIKPRFNLKIKLKIYWFKFLKKFFPKKAKNFGSADYKNLSPIMQQTFKNIINKNLKPYLSKISAKTLIVWGENDEQTPLYMAKILHKKIKNSNLVLIENCGHFCFVERPQQTLNQIKLFLRYNNEFF